MLEVLLRIPGGPLQYFHAARVDKATSNFVLRGFNGAVEYFRAKEQALDAEFWQNFSSGETSNSGEKSMAQYQQMVAGAIDHINRHKLDKVVLSRPFYWEVQGTNPGLTFNALLENYPSCTVFAMKHEIHGAWMGASPEVLLERVEDGFRSMSLAGTRLVGSTLWGIKELEEQKYVTKEVHRALKKFGGKVSRSKQQTFQAGPVEHLLTWVHSDNIELDAKELSEELHPTPAICGAPSDAAKALIDESEGYDRSLYAGYFGLYDSKVHATVLLRTMQWFDHGVRFYAGGGITKDSVPLDEWMETEHKISALKELIQFNDLK